MYVTLMIQAVTRYRGRFFLVLLIFLFTLLACLRGDVGTDTRSYEQLFFHFLDDYHWNGWEPGFVAVGRSLVAVLPTIELAVRFVSVFIFGCFGVYLFRSDQNERFILIAYIFPAFIWQYSMNALRLGLASAVLLLAVQMARTRGGTALQRIGAISILFHYSAIFSLLFLTLAQRRWFKLSSLLIVVVLGVVAGVLIVIAQDYFLKKMSIYHQMEAPNMFSGLRNIIPVLIIALGVLCGKLPRNIKIKLFVLSMGSLATGFLLAQVTYAGLRLLDLIAYAFPLAILICYQQQGLDLSRSTRIGIFIAGLLAAGAVWRGFLNEAGVGPTPFLPYQLEGF